MKNRINILHLEDSLLDYRFIQSFIENGEINNKSFWAENEDQFNEILETQSIDIVLSDYNLPNYDGKQAFKLIKEKYVNIPFIFVSGTMGEDAAINAMLDGATDYVLKNKLERLVPAIKRAIFEHELVTKRRHAEIKLKETNAMIEAQNQRYIKINSELAFQNQEKEKRAAELLIANKELVFQNKEKENRANEYSILNEELIESLNQIQNINNELIIAKNNAEESDKLKSAFLANMSHEIRTPMNAIVGFSEFLLQPELTKEELDRFVHIVHASSQQLLTIISDIVDISKIQAGQFSVESETVDINSLMNELLFTYKKLVGSKKLNLNLSTDLPDSLVQIETDKNRVRQIFCNLLNNAMKFTKEGEIEFGYTTKANFIEFFVKDHGIGITPSDQSRIFESFMQTKALKGELNSGNGLGLSISKALVEKLGGTIRVDSKPGVGSSFFFTIPTVKVKHLTNNK
jgi:signal transduction histidine kinase